MRNLLASVLVVAACAKSAVPTQSTPSSATPSASNDSALFPASWPALRDLDAATEPARIAELARKARTQLDEEFGLSTHDAAHAEAYKRLSIRVRIAHDNAMLATGKSLEALADLAKEPFGCSEAPQRARGACDSLMAGLATAFPNVITAPGRIAQVDHSLVVDAATSEDQLTAFVRKASAFKGSVVQRMRLTSATPGVLRIGPSFQLRVSSKQRLDGGSVVWVAFEPRNIRHVGKTWDLTDATVLFVEPSESP